jgi:predicted Holliday junction resolvase-like endonuclease
MSGFISTHKVDLALGVICALLIVVIAVLAYFWLESKKANDELTRKSESNSLRISELEKSKLSAMQNRNAAIAEQTKYAKLLEDVDKQLKSVVV